MVGLRAYGVNATIGALQFKNYYPSDWEQQFASWKVLDKF